MIMNLKVGKGVRLMLVRKIQRGLILLLVLIAAGLFAQNWEPIVPGIDYGYFRVDQMNLDIFVTRMDRTVPVLLVDASLAKGRITQPGTGTSLETIPAQAARYDGASGFWGRSDGPYRYKVIAAVNGCGFSSANGCPDSAMVMNGSLIKQTFRSKAELKGDIGFGYRFGSGGAFPGSPCMAGTVSFPEGRQQNSISFADGSWFPFQGINQISRAGISLFTHHYGARTPETVNATEIVVRMDDSQPLRLQEKSGFSRGSAVKIVKNSSGGTLIPFDCVVIVATGPWAQRVSGKIPSDGTEIRFSLSVEDATSLDWSGMHAAIGPMWGVILRGGKKPQTASDSYHKAVHPRTAVAFNDRHVFFVVVDGRSSRSAGITLNNLAEFCQVSLGATDAVNNDGGGSSTMWVNGQVKNVPSDGSPRGVANGLMMIQLQPRERSAAFAAGQSVSVSAGSGVVSVMTGPGTNFHAFHDLSSGTPAAIADHAFNGIRGQDAGGAPVYWWKITAESAIEGWVRESDMIAAAPGGESGTRK